MDKINGLKVGLFCENLRYLREILFVSRRFRRCSPKVWLKSNLEDYFVHLLTRKSG
jgi:hypothetical protein